MQADLLLILENSDVILISLLLCWQSKILCNEALIIDS